MGGTAADREQDPDAPRVDGQAGAQASLTQLDQRHLVVTARRPAVGTNREKGRTCDQLYNEAKQRSIKGRSKMTKDQLRRAVDAKK